jgi:uncharacterized protein (TIGR03435 family)
MESFVKWLPGASGGYINLPVVNQTSLNGTWDFELKWTPHQSLQRAAQEGMTIFDALDKELGLKLTLQTAPRSVLIVDDVNETPTLNPSSTATERLRLSPPQFEVATIKPSKPNSPLTWLTDSSEVDIRGVTLHFLITFAWDLNPNNHDLLAGAPRWFDSDRFDVHAKIADEGLETPGNARNIDQEDLRQMLRTLLIERFNLKFHIQNQLGAVYALRAIRPKLGEADPVSRTRCAEGPGPDGKDPRLQHPIINRLVTCENINMAQFANQLHLFAGGYIYQDVLDETGLKGNWSFTLEFSSLDRLQAANADPVAATEEDPLVISSQPSGGVSLFDAIQSELGLKLEKLHRPVPVLVIDHVDQHPTAN